MDELHAAGDGRAEANAVVRAVNVVVHCLGDGDDGEAFHVQALAVGERVITANGDQHVNAKELEVFEHMRREITHGGILQLGLGVLRILQEIRHIGRLDLAGIGAAGVEKGAARAVNCARILYIERHDVLADGFGIVAVEVEQAAPPATNANHLMSLVGGATHRRFNAGVQSRDVTAAGQNADSHGNSFDLVWCCRSSKSIHKRVVFQYAQGRRHWSATVRWGSAVQQAAPPVAQSHAARDAPIVHILAHAPISAH